MNIQGINKLRRVTRWIQRRIGSKAIILMYHRVANPDSDPWSLCVSPEHFEEHLEVLRKHLYSMQLQQLVEALGSGNVPDRAVVVTFDDGYADNLYNAKPLLEHYDIPATFFITTGCIGQGREFWWDELERILLQPGKLPETLCLNINGTSYQWELGQSAFYSYEEYSKHCCWNVDQKIDPTPRHRLFHLLYSLLYPLRSSEKRNVLGKLSELADSERTVRPTHRTLLSDEVVHLAKGELVEIGSHTVTDPALSALPLVMQQEEIQQSKTRLEKIIGHPVTSFSYPHGSYMAETIAVIREAGFTCACSSISDVVLQSADCLQLPRVMVKDWDRDIFTYRLKKWLHG